MKTLIMVRIHLHSIIIVHLAFSLTQIMKYDVA